MNKVSSKDRPFQPTRKPNTYRVEGTTAFVKLNHGQETAVDVSDLKRVLQYRWCAHLERGTRYAAVSRIEGQKQMRLHQFLFNLDGLLRDHWDGNSLNNRKGNLRVATSSQNSQNRRKTSCTTSSRFKGVTWSKASSKWQAGIQMKGKSTHLGMFISESDAARAYDSAAIKLWGKFARTNYARPHLALK